jgi:hypothetical protein
MNPASPSARAIVIGAGRSEPVSMHVTRREFPEASDYWDGNWVYATIQIRAGAFRETFASRLIVTVAPTQGLEPKKKRK